MFDEQLTELVQRHYAAEDAPLLLLSGLGQLVTKSGIQPEPGDRRTLREIIEGIAELALVRDPQANAFIAVVCRGDEARAEQVIVERHRCRFLKKVARPVILAFVAETGDQPVWVQLEPKPRYHAGRPEGGEWIEVDADLRLPGLLVHDIDRLGPNQTKDLEALIRAWCDRHGIDVARLERPASRTPSAVVAQHDLASPGVKAATALERLLEAQDPTLAKRFIVPIDIALVLSRMP